MPAPHGTRTRYNSRKDPCRCEPCTEANNAASRAHYAARKAQGTASVHSPAAWKLPIADRIAARVERLDNGCWRWTGQIATSGYGTMSYQNRPQYVHRLSYEAHRGPIPEGLFLDHLCRNPPCCNPEHLEPVTPRENVLRGEAPSAKSVRENRCARGHEFTPENTYIRPDGHGRMCVTCCRAREARRREATPPEVLEERHNEWWNE